MLLEEISESLVSELLKALTALPSDDADRLEGVVVELNSLAGHGPSLAASSASAGASFSFALVVKATVGFFHAIHGLSG